METECFKSLLSSNKKRKNNNNNNNNMRRFSDEQIRLLETMFESETKLEPRKKMQLARELGLQPRQVAIWFQNKRARWKSKQLERDYGVLMSNYTTLASKFDALKKDKQSLLVQLQKLNDLVDKSREESKGCMKEMAENIDTRIPDNGDANDEPELKPRLNMEKSEYGISILSDDDRSIKTEYFGLDEQEPELLNMVESADGSLTSSENWDLDSNSLYDQSSSDSYQWWDFWA